MSFYDSTAQSTPSLDREPPTKKLRSSFNEYRNRPRPQPVTEHEEEDEYLRYCKEPLVELGDGVTPLRWWLHDPRAKNYPCLQRMAWDILSIPNMSSSNERSFSQTKNTVTAKRGSMDAFTMEQIECLRSWNGSGLLGVVSYPYTYRTHTNYNRIHHIMISTNGQG